MDKQPRDLRAATAAPVALLLVLLAVGSTLFSRLASAPSPQREIAGYATNLKGRTASQRHNARLAALALDGRVIAPGAVFSFNQAVKSWSVDEGYVKAPVSFDGELVRAYGGGVCQTSTTLYNAALLAGLPILERHPHVFRPQYIPPGRDAAVAYPGVDLRFRNSYAWPMRVRASAEGGKLQVRLLGGERPSASIHIATEIVSSTTPVRLTRIARRAGSPLRESTPSDDARRRAYLRSAGEAGYRVVTYRVFSQSGRAVRRERLSDDTYPAMNRVIALTETPQ
ncbi:MAG TPA: VanW family protein [Abditibacteriaceae bacterium]|nr:VanW family protein [Abditibacteriaceae bacterium]